MSVLADTAQNPIWVTLVVGLAGFVASILALVFGPLISDKVARTREAAARKEANRRESVSRLRTAYADSLAAMRKAIETARGVIYDTDIAEIPESFERTRAKVIALRFAVGQLANALADGAGKLDLEHDRVAQEIRSLIRQAEAVHPDTIRDAEQIFQAYDWGECIEPAMIREQVEDAAREIEARLDALKEMLAAKARDHLHALG